MKCMAKEELLEFDGVVTDILPDARYRVKLENDHEIIAYRSPGAYFDRHQMYKPNRLASENSDFDFGSLFLHFFSHAILRSALASISCLVRIPGVSET